MYSNSLIRLLEKIQKAGYGDKVEEILKLDERILFSLSGLDEGFKSGLKIALNGKSFASRYKKLSLLSEVEWRHYLSDDVDYSLWSSNMLETLYSAEDNQAYAIESVLLNEDLKNAKLTNKAVAIIKESTTLFQANYAAKVLCDKQAIEAGIALKGARIILQSENEFNAKYAAEVLCDSEAIEAGIAIEGAKLINKSLEDHNAEWACYLLVDKDAIIASTALNGVKLINKCAYACQSIKIFDILSDQYILRTWKDPLKAAEVITYFRLEDDIECIMNILYKLGATNFDLAIKGAMLLKDEIYYKIVEEVSNYIIDNKDDKNVLEKAQNLLIKLNEEEKQKEIERHKPKTEIDELILYIKSSGLGDIKSSTLTRKKKEATKAQK